MKVNLNNAEEYITKCEEFARSYKYHNDDDTLQLCADVLRLGELASELVRRLQYVREKLGEMDKDE